MASTDNPYKGYSEIDISNPDELTKDEVDGYISYCLTEYRHRPHLRDEDLWETLTEDFQGWTGEIFGTASRYVTRDLRNHLRANGVYVNRARFASIANELARVVAEEPHQWTPVEVEEQIKASEFNSRHATPPRQRTPPTTNPTTALLPTMVPLPPSSRESQQLSDNSQRRHNTRFPVIPTPPPPPEGESPWITEAQEARQSVQLPLREQPRRSPSPRFLLLRPSPQRTAPSRPKSMNFPVPVSPPLEQNASQLPDAQSPWLPQVEEARQAIQLAPLGTFDGQPRRLLSPGICLLPPRSQATVSINGRELTTLMKLLTNDEHKKNMLPEEFQGPRIDKLQAGAATVQLGIEATTSIGTVDADTRVEDPRLGKTTSTPTAASQLQCDLKSQAHRTGMIRALQLARAFAHLARGHIWKLRRVYHFDYG